MGAPPILLLVLACRPSIVPEDWCVASGDPPGDPIYRNCVIQEEQSGDTRETVTDALGRTTSEVWAPGGYTYQTETEWDGACLSWQSSQTWIEAELREVHERWQACDDDGNVTTATGTTTTWSGDESTMHSGSSTTTYTYDSEGRPVVAVTTEDGEDGPGETTTCTYTDWAGPDACVTDRQSDGTDREHLDNDVWYEWAYDGDGNTLAYSLYSMNPGYQMDQTWTRDELGRTATFAYYNSAMGDHDTGEYVYGGRVLDHVEWHVGSVDFGDLATTYTYRPK